MTTCSTCRYFVMNEPVPVPEAIGIPELPKRKWWDWGVQPRANVWRYLDATHLRQRAIWHNNSGRCHWARETMRKEQDSFCRHHAPPDTP